jgi:glucose/arabinose dehydrogenase
MRLVLLFALVGAFVTAGVASAHPPSAPFDNTIFAPIQPGGYTLGLETVATGLTAPNKAVVAPGDLGAIYVVDQPGKIWRVDLATGAKTVFFDVSSRLVPLGFLGPGTFDERGLLGLAFHPNYALNGRLYTYTSEPTSGPPTVPATTATPDHQNVVAEWTATMGVVNPASRRELLRENHPQFNHDGGDLAFGPDGMLYISDGDGGNADDEGPGHLPGGNAQSLGNVLGKILRIDVDRTSPGKAYAIPADNPFVGMPGALGEIWAYGFRNPFRLSFDRATGDLYVGDVGQNDIEEVDLVVKGGNYGWNRKEGTLFFFPNGAAAPGFASTTDNGMTPAGVIDPIAQYDTHHEGHSVIGGYVYRGTKLSQLRGKYVFADFSRAFRFPSGPNDQGRIFTLQQLDGKGLAQINEVHLAGQTALGKANQTGSEGIGIGVLGLGEDAAGELYVLGNPSGTPFGTAGRVLRLVGR